MNHDFALLLAAWVLAAAILLGLRRVAPPFARPWEGLPEHLEGVARENLRALAELRRARWARRLALALVLLAAVAQLTGLAPLTLAGISILAAAALTGLERLGRSRDLEGLEALWDTRGGARVLAANRARTREKDDHLTAYVTGRAAPPPLIPLWRRALPAELIGWSVPLGVSVWMIGPIFTGQGFSHAPPLPDAPPSQTARSDAGDTPEPLPPTEQAWARKLEANVAPLTSATAPEDAPSGGRHAPRTPVPDRKVPEPDRPGRTTPGPPLELSGPGTPSQSALTGGLPAVRRQPLPLWMTRTEDP